MSSKLYSRSGVFAWSPHTVDHKGLIVADFAQFYDPSAGSVEQKIDFISSTDILAKSQLQPTVSVGSAFRFNDLCWSHLTSQNHPSGIVAGGTEDGSVVFFDAHSLFAQSKLEVLSSRRDHHGHVLSVDVSMDGRWVASGGGSGQVLLWDTSNLTSPYSPGAPNFNDQIKSVRWNRKNESVFTSASAQRVSCWDLRRHGAPVLEFAEVGHGCDWSCMSWHPSDASQLLVASQSAQVPVVQKWDLRFATAPISEFRHHARGVTSIDWNRRDERLVVSCGCDGQIAIWNPDNGEIMGGVGSLQGDWIRSVKWNPAEPSQLAIQYSQHPVQLVSLTSMGTPQAEAEVLAPRISDTFIPAWMSAPLIGASMALGGRVATHWKSYDALSQKWVHNVEVESIPQDTQIVQDMVEFVESKDSSRKLIRYIEERILGNSDVDDENIEIKTLVWQFVVAQLENRSRKKMLSFLGVQDNIESVKTKGSVSRTTADYTTSSNCITTRSSTTATRSRTRSSNTSSPSSSITDTEHSCLEHIESVRWDSVDEFGWSLLDKTIEQDHEAVVDSLCERRSYMSAVMYAAKHKVLDRVFSHYLKHENISELDALVLSLSGMSLAESKTGNRFEGFPDDKWTTLLAYLISSEKSGSELARDARKLGLQWLDAGLRLRACIAFVVAGDVESLVLANTDFKLDERVKQVMSLYKAGHTVYTSFGENCEEIFAEYGRYLLNNGVTEAAWRLFSDLENTKNAELIEVRYTLWSVSGGRDCTGDKPPKNPFLPEDTPATPQRQFHEPTCSNAFKTQSSGIYNPVLSQAPPPPVEYNQRRDSNLAPMPPSSMFYQTPSWDHKPPPSMPNIPPPKPSGPVASGWNDPPPLAAKAVSTPPNVLQVSWKPLETTPAGVGAMGFPPQNAWNGITVAPPLMQGMQGMGLSAQRPPSVASSSQLSSHSPAAVPAPPPTPPLSADDERIFASLDKVITWIIDSTRTHDRAEKAKNVRNRLKTELLPRLAQDRVSPDTRQHLHYIANFADSGQFRDAQGAVGQMARSSSDFVEISSFLPALKSLFSLAQNH